MEAGARLAGIADFFAAVGLARVKSFIDERFFRGGGDGSHML